MKDRVSLYPGRVKLEPVAGQANLYDLTRADQPTQEGTPLNKANLLSDATETAMFGAAADRTVDEAFAGLAAQIKLIMSNTAAITLTLKDSAGRALPGVLVQGILTERGQAVYSGTDGVAAGYIAEGSQTIKVTGYADIEDYTETIAVTKGTSITKTLTLTTRNFLKITSSKPVKFSGNVNTVDVTVVGGGGGGSSSITDKQNVQCGGNGGGGGNCVLQMDVTVTENQSYSAIIGAGGSGGVHDTRYNAIGQTGKDGGQSSFMGVTAAGGKGGGSNTLSSAGVQRTTAASGNGAGGLGAYISDMSSAIETPGSKGGDGTVQGYVSFTEKTLFGGGGGGGMGAFNQTSNDVGYAGGSSYGAAGGDITTSTSRANGRSAAANTGGGGGGSGMESTNGEGAPKNADGGSGGSGVVTIRIHLKSAA